MEEKNSVLAVLKVLGDKINVLEEELDTQKMWREIAENKVTALQTENNKLNSMLTEVHTYIDRMEEK